ncbi:hypothetical protein M413DRAFT_422839 [Hebeloma cylindrosporum]|uniref:HNH nuclease domain-containing protein n=1 Tax=Hebeloma cylindrosporum TaxID=76867 RepID=A0A0C2Z1R1_HEBCY|nr:hypothetical protein M413DRAFT_422839 [Hebeloma cylindrosporum h7]
MHHCTVFPETICTTLKCTPDEFWSIYNNNDLATDALSDEILTNVIGAKHERLRAADRRCRLDDLVSGMIIHAPHPLGLRYVAVCLRIAHQKGEDTVFRLANAWMEQLFLPMLAMSSVVTDILQTPEPEAREFKKTVAIREEYFCALTGYFDNDRASALFAHGREAEIPKVPLYPKMAATHIMPSSLNDFGEKEIGLEIRYDMLQSWTQIDLQSLAGTKINSPANAILLSSLEHEAFRKFNIYLDKDAYPSSPNKYRMRLVRPSVVLTNGSRGCDVEFRTLAQSGIEPPNPTFIRAHAAFAKVLEFCGASQYFESVERDAEDFGFLPENGDTDIGSLLMAKLAITTLPASKPVYFALCVGIPSYLATLRWIEVNGNEMHPALASIAAFDPVTEHNAENMEA